jgi:hypothetical protein
VKRKKLPPKALRPKKRAKRRAKASAASVHAKAARLTIIAAKALVKAQALVDAALHGESLALEHGREVHRDK